VTRRPGLAWRKKIISIHTLRVEGDFTSDKRYPVRDIFQSTPSGWRVTHTPVYLQDLQGISIHTLRVEGDLEKRCEVIEEKIFQSTPSGWRVTKSIGKHALCSLFQSTPSGWRVTLELLDTKKFAELFQSTPSGWRVTPNKKFISGGRQISIHTLRVEGDRLGRNQRPDGVYFNPHPPGGG